MAWNEHHQSCWFAGLAALALAGCSVTGERESPLNEVTRGSPTVVQIYRGQAAAGAPVVAQGQAHESAQASLRRDVAARPIAASDGNTRRYWSALDPMRQRFARVPNPDLVMVVYPHLAKGKYPVPGYVTVFPMYEQVHYVLPGEVAQDLVEMRALLRAGVDPSARERVHPADVRAAEALEPHGR